MEGISSIPQPEKSLLVKLLTNIKSHPSDIKYRRLKFSGRIASLCSSSLALLEFLGFTRVVEEDQEMLILSTPDVPTVSRVITALQTRDCPIANEQAQIQAMLRRKKKSSKNSERDAIKSRIAASQKDRDQFKLPAQSSRATSMQFGARDMVVPPPPPPKKG